eukprot:3098988-Pyramimonas_sp.AAC.1
MLLINRASMCVNGVLAISHHSLNTFLEERVMEEVTRYSLFSPRSVVALAQRSHQRSMIRDLSTGQRLWLADRGGFSMNLA